MFKNTFQQETSCEHASNKPAANVSAWAYATTTRDENAMKVAVALYGKNKSGFLIGQLKY